METTVIDIKMDKDAAEFALKVLNEAGYADEESQRAIEALANALSNASKVHNPHESFGGGMNAATDEEAAESLK